MLRINVNNNQTIELSQQTTNNSILVETTNSKHDTETSYNISSGDMVMLFNYYRYIKTNNIQCDFINPNGTI